MWHQQTKALQESGEIQIVGIVQEQNPERAALFRQWQGFGWPILVDSYNLMGLSAVPSFWTVDEEGRWISELKNADDLQRFLAMPAVTGARTKPRAKPRQDFTTLPIAPSQLLNATINPDFVYASLLFMPENALVPASPSSTGDAAGDTPRLSALITDLESLLDPLRAGLLEEGASFEAALPAVHFCLGVAYRKRWESSFSQGDDFTQAVKHWALALQSKPSQYIWRRRLEQYGPRLGKPYPFYDWVDEARVAIQARGEKAVPLAVEPSGAEFARPMQAFRVEATIPASAGASIPLDAAGLVRINATLVPNPSKHGEVWRAHIVFTPSGSKWDDNLREIKIHFETPTGVDVSTTVARPSGYGPKERTIIEYEILLDQVLLGQSVRIPSFALYHVCDDQNGTCTYLRQDFELLINTSVLGDAK